MSRRQLLRHGANGTAIARAVKAGRLFPLHRGVFSVLPPVMLSEDGWLIAALLACGKGAKLHHATAAWKLEMIKAPPEEVHLSVPQPRKAPEGVKLHIVRAFRSGEIIRHGRFLMTSPARTALDLAEHYTLHAMLSVLAQGEFRHDLRPAELDAARRRGHDGSARLGIAIKHHTPGFGITMSELEELFRETLIEYDIELPDRNVRVGHHRCDCIWERRGVIVELDGRQHERPHQADLDDDRDLDTRARNHVTRRLGYKQVKGRPADVAADVRRAFEEAALLGFAT